MPCFGIATMTMGGKPIFSLPCEPTDMDKQLINSMDKEIKMRKEIKNAVVLTTWEYLDNG